MIYFEQNPKNRPSSRDHIRSRLLKYSNSYFFSQTDGETAIRIGTISRRPNSIAADSTSLDKTEYSAHARNAADLVYESWVEYYGENPSEFLLNAIVSHMGQWTENKDERPFTSVDRCVHMADYMASRSFIDIPQIVDEYKETADRLSALAEEEVPFLVY